MSALPFCPQPKPEPRVLSEKKQRHARAKLERAFRDFVYTRDHGRCRSCDRRVIRVISRHPDTAEIHHLRSRMLLSDAEQIDPTLAVTLCAICHALLKTTPPKLRQINRTAATVRFEKVKRA